MGEKELLYSQKVGLMGLYGVSANYLFASELTVIEGMPYAYWRWLEHNQKKEKELMELRQLREIDRTLRDNPFLIALVSEIVTMNERELKIAVAAFRKGGAA